MTLFKNFADWEILQPVQCPVKNWNELPSEVAKNLETTMMIVQKIREYLAVPIRITSSWRPRSRGSAHQNGYAIDCQPKVKRNSDWIHKVMEYVVSQEFRQWLKSSGLNKSVWFFIEWEDRNKRGLDSQDTYGWLHVDYGFPGRKSRKQINRRIMAKVYKNGLKKWICKLYRGQNPWDYAK